MLAYAVAVLPSRSLSPEPTIVLLAIVQLPIVAPDAPTVLPLTRHEETLLL